MTVWSLVDGSAHYFRNPKHSPSSAGLAWRADRRYLAVLDRRDCKDNISVIHVPSWTLVKEIPLPTLDAADMQWSPCGRYIACWDTVLESWLGVYHPDGRCVTMYEPTSGTLGIRTARWSPSAQFLAVGTFDGKVRLLNQHTWKELVTLQTSATVERPRRRHDLSVFAQISDAERESEKLSTNMVEMTRFPCNLLEAQGKQTAKNAAQTRLLTMLSASAGATGMSAEESRKLSRGGVALIEWNCDGTLMAVKNGDFTFLGDFGCYLASH